MFFFLSPLLIFNQVAIFMFAKATPHAVVNMYSDGSQGEIHIPVQKSDVHTTSSVNGLKSAG